MPLTTTPSGSRPNPSPGGSAARAFLCTTAILGIGSALLAWHTVRPSVSSPPGNAIRVAISSPPSHPSPPPTPPALPNFRTTPPPWTPPVLIPSVQPPEIAEFTPLPLPDTPPFDPFATDVTPEAPEELPPIPRRRHSPHPTPPTTASAPTPATPSPESFTPPTYLSAPPPPYPAALRQSGIEGTVRLRVTLAPSGHPLSVTILQSSGHSQFDSSAKDWVLRHWLFYPAKKNGLPTAASIVTSVRFVLAK